MGMNNVSVKIFYAKGLKLSLSQRTFTEAMELVWKSPAFQNHSPLKMVFTSTGKMLFMDQQAFHSFLNNKITMKELVELTECDELYRNIKEVIVTKDFSVDVGQLWKLKKETLYLVDDDNFVSSKLDLNVFEIAI